jgi:hypothetical protein
MLRTPLFLLLSAAFFSVFFEGCAGGGGQSSVLSPTLAISSAQSTSQTAPTRGSEAAMTAPAPSGTYWTGTVSSITGYGIVADCGQHNFAQGFGCLPVTTTGATITGTPLPGQYFQMWGDLSNL